MESRDQIVAEFSETRHAILTAAAALPPGCERNVFLGIWSAHDLLAHLAGWDVTNREAIAQLLHGRLPSFLSEFDPGWRAYNAQLVAVYGQVSWPDLIQTARHTQQRLVGLVMSIPASAFFEDRGLRWKGRRVTIAWLIRSEVDDEKVHQQQITSYRDGCQKSP